MDGSSTFAALAPSFLHNLAVADIDGSGRLSAFLSSITVDTVPQLSDLLINDGNSGFHQTRAGLPTPFQKDHYAEGFVNTAPESLDSLTTRAARSFAFGAGGSSSRLKTRRLSLSDNETCSASSMTAFAARRAW